jgi:predicted permease
MSSLRQDLSYTLRVLRKNPGFTAVAVLCMALGIGANSTIFSLADALLLRPLPVPDPSGLLTVRGTSPGDAYQEVSYPDYADLRSQCGSFESLAAYSVARLSYSPRAGGVSNVKLGLLVSGNFFRVMGAEPEIGRGFRAEEDQAPGRDAVAVISHALFRTEYNSDQSVLGQTIRLNGIDFTIVGVAPERFTGIDQYLRPEVYVPIMMVSRLNGSRGRDFLETRGYRDLLLKGRLKPGVSRVAAEGELAAISGNLERAWPDTNRGYTFLVRTELQHRIDRSPPEAMLVAMLACLAGFVLIIACANVANLLLSRARSRSREIALRMALGAGRGRLIRQLLTESLALAIAGGSVGLLLAEWGAELISSIQVPADPPLILAVRLDHRALLFTLAASVASALLFGLVPAWYTTRTELVRALKAGDAGAAGRRHFLGRNLLVAGQVAISFVLLYAAFSFLRDFRAKLAAGPGFRSDHLLMMSFDPTLAGYRQDQIERFYRSLEEQARSLAGARRVALTSYVPLGLNGDEENIVPEGFQMPAGRVSLPGLTAVVTPDYFDALRIPIVRGRGFRISDLDMSPRVAVVNEVMAQRFWPGQDAIGKRFRLQGPNGPWVEIVGIARTAKYAWIAEPPTRFFYLPQSQNYRANMTLLVESTGDPVQSAGPLRELVRSLDADLPVFDVRTMEDFFHKRAVLIPSVIIGLVASLGMLGLALALVGLYGLVSYLVSRQTREIGIRMAVGADRSGVLRQFLRKGLVLSAVGILIGFAGTLASHPFMRAAFGLGPVDLAGLVVLPVVLLGVTTLASLAPALRASRIDPAAALRDE